MGGHQQPIIREGIRLLTWWPFYILQPMAHKETLYWCRSQPRSISRIGECSLTFLVLTPVTWGLWCHCLFDIFACLDLLLRHAISLSMLLQWLAIKWLGHWIALFHPGQEYENFLVFHFLLVHIHAFGGIVINILNKAFFKAPIFLLHLKLFLGKKYF